MKHLHRSKNKRIFAGICGGLGDYFSVDPTLVRVLFILFAVLTEIIPFVIAYIIAAFIIPEEK